MVSFCLTDILIAFDQILERKKSANGINTWKGASRVAYTNGLVDVIPGLQVCVYSCWSGTKHVLLVGAESYRC